MEFSGIFEDRVKEYTSIIEGNIEEPEKCYFCNWEKAIMLLRKHINGDKSIVVHCDIDMDGIGSGYIMYRFFALEGCIQKIKMAINNDRVHGISKKFVDVVNENKVGLVVILDSSSNAVDLIKQIKADVLVVDHHELDHQELSGETADGEYVIVNNTVSSDKYTIDKRMSAGLVVYELLRHFYSGETNKLDEEYLFNWVVVTLFTDTILLDNKRNQYYLEQSFDIDDIERNLRSLIGQTKQTALSKNSIQYYIAPRINSTIRAHESVKALSCVVYEPSKLLELNKYKEKQAAIMIQADNFVDNKANMGYIMVDISNTGIDSAYCGVIASRLCGLYHKNTVVFSSNGQKCQGSFRGRCDNAKYLEYFKEKVEFAQGHEGAFGFRADMDTLKGVMQSLADKEPKEKLYLTAGDMPEELRGKYHIANKDSMDKFKKDRHMLHLALINSRVSSLEAINIIIPNNGYEYTKDEFGVYYYNVLGLKAKTWNEIKTRYAALYVEFCGGVDVYIKEHYI